MPVTKLSITRAASEFGVARETMANKLRDAGYDTSRGHTWTIKQIYDALREMGELSSVKYRREAAEAELSELDLAKARRNVVDVAEVVDLMTRILQPFRARLLALPPTLGHAANPTDPGFGMAAVAAAVDTLLPLLRDDLIKAFASGTLDAAIDEGAEEDEEEA